MSSPDTGKDLQEAPKSKSKLSRILPPLGLAVGLGMFGIAGAAGVVDSVETHEECAQLKRKLAFAKGFQDAIECMEGAGVAPNTTVTERARVCRKILLETLEQR